jgi:hypothetical protein
MDNSKEHSSTNDIEIAFYNALKKYGYLFPETQEELDCLRIRLSNKNIEIPKEFDNPMEIIKRGFMELKDGFDIESDNIVEENLAQAAREGKEITPDVQNKMDKDREAVEKKREKE